MNCKFCNSEMKYLQGYNICHNHSCLFMTYNYGKTYIEIFGKNGIEISVNLNENTSSFCQLPYHCYNKNTSYMSFNELAMTKDKYTYNVSTKPILTLNKIIKVDPNNFEESINIFKKLLPFL